MWIKTLLGETSPVVSTFGNKLSHNLSALNLAKYSMGKVLQLDYVLTLLSDTIVPKIITISEIT